jgi:hypothetical protein
MYRTEHKYTEQSTVYRTEHIYRTEDKYTEQSIYIEQNTVHRTEHKYTEQSTVYRTEHDIQNRALYTEHSIMFFLSPPPNIDWIQQLFHWGMIKNYITYL